MTLEERKRRFSEAWSYRNQDNTDKALEIAQESLDIAKTEDDKEAQATFLKIFAQIHSDQGRLQESLEQYKAIERLYIELELIDRQMHTLRHIGSLYQELGEAECAEKCLKQVVEAYDKNAPNELEKANTYRVYAITQEDLKNDSEALAYWEKAKLIYQNYGIDEGVNECEDHVKNLS